MNRKRLTLAKFTIFFSFMIAGIHLKTLASDVVGAVDSFNSQELSVITELEKVLSNTIKANRFESISSDNENTVDVLVVVHRTWLDAMKRQETKDDNGKFYENGAQFGIKRIEEQFKALNRVFENQNVNARVRPVYFAISDNDIILTSEGGAKEWMNVFNCTFFYSGYTEGSGLKENCDNNKLGRLNNISRGQIDLVYYIRERFFDHEHYLQTKLGELALGHGSYYYGGAVYDSYFVDVKDYKKCLADIEKGVIFGTCAFRKNLVDSHRFGLRNNGIFLHELGHAFTADHSFIPDTTNNPHFCGDHPRGSFFEQGGSPKSPTIMYTSGTEGQHEFFSDPDITVNGERCGIPNKANNIENVRNAASKIISKGVLTPSLSHVDFVTNEMVVNRAEGKATITVRRTGDLSKSTNINLIAKDGTAWEQRDFEFGLKEVVFAPGEKQKEIDVNILPRSENHRDTEFEIVVLAGLNSTFTEQTVGIKIISDLPEDRGQLSFEKTNIELFEGTLTELSLLRTNGANGPISVRVQSINGNAVAGSDFTSIDRVINFADGQVSASFPIDILNKPGLQGVRSFLLQLSNPTNGVMLGKTTSININISDTVGPGVVSFNSPSEEILETGIATLTLNRTNGTDGIISVRVKSLDGTAVAGTDFTTLDREFYFAEGQSSTVVSIPLKYRPGLQGVRSFELKLSNPNNGAMIGETSLATISISDVTPGVISFSNPKVVVSEADTATLTVNRTKGSDGMISVRVQSINGTAVAGTDFTTLDHVINFAEGQTSATVSIAILKRPGFQSTRSFVVQLSSPTNGVILGETSSATIEIRDVYKSRLLLRIIQLCSHLNDGNANNLCPAKP